VLKNLAKLLISIILLSGLAWAAALHFRSATPLSGDATIKIDNFSFTPSEITIKTGAKVTWTNADDVPHTIRSVDDKFGSKALDTGDQFSFTFTQPGTYEYFCSVHPKMTARIIVK
jgi:plastocyanin